MLKRVLLTVACVCALAGASQAQSPVIVNGYSRSNGTYVQPYYRTAPDGNFYNNWSTKPNVNPFTGQMGTRVNPPMYYSRTYYQPTHNPYYGRQR